MYFIVDMMTRVISRLEASHKIRYNTISIKNKSKILYFVFSLENLMHLVQSQKKWS